MVGLEKIYKKATKAEREKMNLVNKVFRFFLSEEGQTLTEYAMLVLFLALVIIAAITLMGQSLLKTYNDFVTTAFGS
jgi:Flp pilus assembly pilin Flp